MNRLIPAIFVLTTLLGNPREVAATPPQSLTIVQHSSVSCPCTFSATGAMNDAGNETNDSVHATALPSPIVGTAHITRTFHGQFGTLTIHMQTLLTPTDVPWQFHEKGNWVVTGGTGAYAGLKGQGTEAGIRDFRAQTLDAVYTGQVH